MKIESCCVSNSFMFFLSCVILTIFFIERIISIVAANWPNHLEHWNFLSIVMSQWRINFSFITILFIAKELLECLSFSLILHQFLYFLKRIQIDNTKKRFLVLFEMSYEMIWYHICSIIELNIHLEKNHAIDRKSVV